MTQLDEHNQPLNKAFNRRRNIEKSAYVLRGLLQGITSGEDLNQSEIVFLNAWLSKQAYLQLGGDGLDLVESIKSILADGRVTQEESIDLNSLIDTILEFGTPESPYEEPRINEFLGLVKGVCADERLELKEIDFLEDWIDRNADMADKFPVETIYDRIRAAKADGVVDQEEQSELYTLLRELSGENKNLEADCSGAVASIFCDLIEEFSHLNRNFCFSGKFIFGTRKKCEEVAMTLGAEVSPRVSLQVNTLVIGTLTSRDWRFENYGRKIEAALKQKSEHGYPMILSEEQWVGEVKRENSSAR